MWPWVTFTVIRLVQCSNGSFSTVLQQLTRHRASRGLSTTSELPVSCTFSNVSYSICAVRLLAVDCCQREYNWRLPYKLNRFFRPPVWIAFYVTYVFGICRHFCVKWRKKWPLLVQKTRYLVITCYVLLLFCDINWLKYEFNLRLTC